MKLRELLSLFQGDDTPTPAPPPSALPAELVLAIETCEAYWRASRLDDGEALPIVTVAGLGSWVYRTTDDAADRVARTYPDLPRHLCARAARLIEAQIGRRNNAKRLLGQRRKDPYPTDWMEP
ncbi:MAG: hypothetical protein KDK11_15920 [Maritimibacter sp.]|nr:hypothetical protein [Maritimibacter sp.]